jgi:hypothetical protein
MASLSTKIKLYCEANGKTADFSPGTGNVELVDNSDGKGPFISSWSVSGLAQPSDSDLAAHDSAGNTEESNNIVRSTRKAAYGDIGDQLDEIFKDIDAWKARIQGIKDANPKS